MSLAASMAPGARIRATDGVIVTAMYTNIGGVNLADRAPLAELSPRAVDIVCFAETHKYDAIPSIELQGYTTHTCNRAPGLKGGIQVSLLRCSPVVGTQCGIKVVCDAKAGILWVEAPKYCVVFAVCYFSPHQSELYRRGVLHPDPLAILFDGVRAAQIRGLQCIILGDLNIRVGNSCIDMPQPVAGNAVPAILNSVSEALDGPIYHSIPPTRRSRDLVLHSNWGTQFMTSLRGAGMVMLNGRAPGDTEGNFTYHQPHGRGQGQLGASVIDVACITAELYPLVQSFQVLPLDPMMSPDHCPIRLQLSLSEPPRADLGQADSPQTPCITVCRPLGKDRSNAYRKNLRMYEPAFRHMLGCLEDGSLTLSEALHTITSIMRCCCPAPADPSTQPGPAPRGAPWFDDECKSHSISFKEAWSAYLRLKHQGEVEAQHPVAVAARQARRDYARIKRRRRRAYAKQQQIDHLDAYFSDRQRDFWKAFQTSKHPPCPVSNLSQWTSHFQGVFGTAPPPPLQLDEVDTALKQQLFDRFRQPQDCMAPLNAKITREEVQSAMRSLPRFKAADSQGLTCELLRAVACNDFLPKSGGEIEVGEEEVGVACLPLVDCIVYILQHLPSTTEYPELLSTGKLAPVPKKGCIPTDMSTYRGICVSSIFSKLHESVLKRRAEPCIEQHHLRAPEQFGFRSERGTLDALFVTHHLIKRSKHRRQYLYVCYVDFKKAFDTARREDGMLVRARQLGIHGPFLDALSKILQHINLAVCVNGGTGDSFPTYRGTKQGSELSPLLFGLFIEQLRELINMQLPGAGPLIDGMRVPLLMYADDVKLLSVEHTGEAQQLFDVLHLFCRLFDMEVNLAPHKTCIVVYRGPRMPAPPDVNCVFNGKPVPVVEEYTDLGLLHHATKGVTPAVQALALSGTRAMHGLLSKCAQHHITQPAFKLRLFDILVEPVLSYGCQVWGPEACYKQLDTPLDNAADKVHLEYLRHLAGVGKSTPFRMLLREYDRYPVMWHWLTLAVRFWLKAVKLPSSELVHKTLRDDVGLMLDGCKDCWSYHLLSVVSKLGLVAPDQWCPRRSTHPLAVDSILVLTMDEKAVQEALQKRFAEVWDRVDVETQHPCRLSCPSDIILTSTYAAWSRGAGDSPPSYLTTTALSFRMLQCLSRYRLGRHNLAIQTGRYRGIPRQDRVCIVCQALGHTCDDSGHTPVEDLRHFLLDCRALAPIRASFPTLFEPTSLPNASKDTHMRFILNHADHTMVVKCLLSFEAHRKACITLVEEHRLSEIIPSDHLLPIDYNLVRIIAAENALLVESDDGSDFD